MAWDGYVLYGGTEIINVARTEAYAKRAQLPWFKTVYDNDSLPAMLGETYSSPAIDGAPWTDPNAPESYSFYGVFPLQVGGLEDSSRQATVVESIRDGGNPGRLRHGTKAVTFSAVLIGEDEAAVNYGFAWLKTALLAGPCGPTGDCNGDDLCYLASEPIVDLGGSSYTLTPATVAATVDYDGGTASAAGGTVYDGGGASDDNIVQVDLDGGFAFLDPGQSPPTVTVTPIDPTECFDPLLRSLRRVVFTSGPSITSKRQTSDGSAIWTVSFTATAGDPWEFGSEQEIIQGFLDPAVTVPWVGGVIPDGGYIDLDGHLFNEQDCAEPTAMPLQDPLCPGTIPPPIPPSITLGCFTLPRNWRRRQITIPASNIPLWGDVVPKVSIHARTTDVRNLRLRFYADVDGDGDISDDPCAYCGDLLFSFIPQGYTLTFDASSREVYVVGANQNKRRADSVVFSTNGSPFDWPTLTCGMGYIVTLDLPQTQHPPVFDLSLFSRTT